MKKENLLKSKTYLKKKKVKIYTGILGQYGDIIMFTAIVKRIKELIPNSEITFAISKKYRDMKPLLMRDSLIDKVFVTQNYFEKLHRGNYFQRGKKNRLFNKGVYIDLRGEDEIREQAKNDIVFETRPQHRDLEWFKKIHQVMQLGKDIGINLENIKTRIFPEDKIPKKFNLKPKEYIIIHTKSGAKHKGWNKINELKKLLGNERLFVVQDEKTTIMELATIIKNAKLFIGIDSMPLWMAGSFDIPVIGLYGSLQYNIVTRYIYPKTKKFIALQVRGHPNKIKSSEIINTMTKLGVKKNESFKKEIQ